MRSAAELKLNRISVMRGDFNAADIRRGKGRHYIRDSFTRTATAPVVLESAARVNIIYCVPNSSAEWQPSEANRFLLPSLAKGELGCHPEGVLLRFCERRRE